MAVVSVDSDRRDGEPARLRILDAALPTFARYGYRKTSVDDVARAAKISRPGLYLHFSSKQDLFRAAVTHALDLDLAAAQHVLEDPAAGALRDRLILAFDHWTGRYIGLITHDITALIDSSSPDLLGPDIAGYPVRFASLVTGALIEATPTDQEPVARDAAQTLLNAAIGIKHHSTTREDFRDRLTHTVDLVLLAVQAAPGSPAPKPHRQLPRSEHS